MVDEKQSVKENERHYIKGILLHTIFQNEAEHFSIVKVKIQKTNEDYTNKDVVLKGYFANLQYGKVYCFYGEFERHPRFGLQYSVTNYESMLPKTRDGVIQYLASGLFKGIGKKIATRIVDMLGENAITAILNHPSVLDSITGLSKEKAATLAKTLQENEGFEQVMIHLAKYGVGLKMAQNIYQVYKNETLEHITKDPYQLVFDVEGFGFQRADEMAQQNGLPLTHPNRIGAGCIYVLQKSVQDGHVYLPIDVCKKQVKQLLYHHEQALSDETIDELFVTLNAEKKVIVHEECVYLPSLYYAEDGFASSMERLMTKQKDEETVLAELMKIIGDIEEQETLSYGKEQFEAIKLALDSKIMILTGGPGTGKTTVIKGILKAYAEMNDISLDPFDYDKKDDFPFILTAPTGRAAKRMNESTGLPAVTIHRLLGWNGKDGFDRDKDDPLTGKFLIVDEFSMVDIWLANSLFKAIPSDMQVLLVGDEDQLPSVGPGQVLSDLLKSKQIPFIGLHDVYRQKEGSKIIQLAHEIKQDVCTIDSLKNDQDFSFIPCNEEQMISGITQIYKVAQKKGMDVKQIQVLAPMYKTRAGITAINQALQELLNPKTSQKREVKLQDTVFRIGDKVIQLVNQPEDNVFNGDIGEVVAIFTEDENTDHVEQLVVSFDGKEVVYERKNYINIMHAYCISIHKSQGSEFPIVLLPVVHVYRRMLRKNLLYTAITRSKESLIICGEVDAFLRGITTIDTNRRYTSLQAQLHERKIAKGEIADESVDMKADDTLSPYDFM